ncbi:MAG: glycosyltransferase family 4 protein [Tildeniella torsiva UHER 1998/13D]|jgi:glycosyltransferase involved in cell wall biosynthesis|nr:glycosyltransferase family 4 protein [Tildeniella torsiva UHER 1998/13D]
METLQVEVAPSTSPQIAPINLLLSAYACNPEKGSEPGVGWNMAKELANHHQVTLLTRESNRQAIETSLGQAPVTNLTVVFCDVPILQGWFKQQQNLSVYLLHIHHYLWQWVVYLHAKKLHKTQNFELVHHVTYGRYSAPSFLSFLPVPFIFGPVGGGESAPAPFWQDFSLGNKFYEYMRNILRWIGERDPFVRLTIKNSDVAIVATPETALRLSRLGAKRIERIYGQTGINQQELVRLGQLPEPSTGSKIRFISIGRLLHWKGFYLGLRAFAQADLSDGEYWIVGDGAERKTLEALANNLGVGNRVKFWGNLSREQTLAKLGECDVLVHPSLHDFSPTVCLEGMAAGRPVICLDLGGPATQITHETGFKVPAHTPEQAVQDMAKVMETLAKAGPLRQQMGQAGRQRVSELYSWPSKGAFLNQIYRDVISQA